MAATKKNLVEAPEDALKSVLSERPYRYIIFERMNGEAPLFLVAGLQGGPWSSENALRKAFATHGGKCFYCKTTLSKETLTIDHVEGRAGLASSVIQNLVLSCKQCNNRKGHQPIDAFAPDAGREWLTALLEQVEDRLKKLDAAAAPSTKTKAPTAASPAEPSAKSSAR